MLTSQRAALAAAALLLIGATTGASAYQCKGVNTFGSVVTAQPAAAR